MSIATVVLANEAVCVLRQDRYVDVKRHDMVEIETGTLVKATFTNEYFNGEVKLDTDDNAVHLTQTTRQGVILSQAVLTNTTPNIVAAVVTAMLEI